MSIDYDALIRQSREEKLRRGMTGAEIEAASKRKRRKAKRSVEKALREMKP